MVMEKRRGMGRFSCEVVVVSVMGKVGARKRVL